MIARPTLSLRRLMAAATVLTVITSARIAIAGCNLIPAAEKSFPSTLGGIDSPITAGGRTVTIRLNPQCDTSPGFDSNNDADNTVTLIFEPPGGGAATQVVINSVDVTVPDALTLQFDMPAAATLQALLPPHGLAGPARIEVRDPGMVLLAEIGPLFQPTATCDREPETIFQKFTVLPLPNIVADLVSGAATQIRATLDGSNSILIPLDHVLVLPAGPNAPIARFLSANSAIDAFTSNPGVPVDVPDQSFVRSFTLHGRTLPPLLRVNDTGDQFYGTTDAEQSVIRIARTDGMGGPAIYDFTDRLFMGQGPIVIDKFADGFTVTSGPAVPLEGLQSSVDVVAYARDESIDGNLNAGSGDGDPNDQVVQIVNVADGTSTATGKAVLSVTTGPFSAPSIVTGGSLTAFLESEADQNNTPQNGDGDTLDGILRVYDADGTDLTAALDISASNQRVINGRELAISGPLVFFRTPRTLSVVETETDGVGGVDGLGGTNKIAVSPDGRHFYATGAGDSAVAVFSRDADSGQLSFVEVEKDGVGGVDGLFGALAVAVSPDGLNVYVVGGAENAIAVFSRNSATGALTFVEVEIDGVGGVDGLSSPQDVEVSPDGKHVYVAGWGESKIAIFARNTMTGALTFVDIALPGHFGIDLAISGDGRTVYSSGAGDTTVLVAAFSRDPMSGQLTFVDSEPGGVPGGVGNPGVAEVIVSPDGAHVYVTGVDALFNPGGNIYRRDPTTGALEFVDVIPFAAAASTPFVPQLAFSPDGSHLYTPGFPENNLTFFARNASDGGLTRLDTFNFLGARAAFVSPGDSHTYIADGNSSVTVFSNGGPLLEAFDTGTMTLRPGLGVRASAAAVAAQRAGILTSEEDGVTAVDANNDGDSLDVVAQLYDGASDTVTPLGIAATRIALSDQLLALTVPEASEDNLPRNNDGDALDDVLAVQTLPLGVMPAVQNVGVAADAIAVTGNTVVFTTPESAEGPSGTGCGPTMPPGGCDFNGDGDATDRVLRAQNGSVIETGRAAEEFVVGGNLVAFRTSEEAQNGADLNFDGDTADAVMFVYDVANDVLIPTDQAAIPCTLGGCDPFEPYKIKGELVSFITQEADQAPNGIGCQPTLTPGECDLNGDGDGTDIVMQAFNVRTRERFVFDLGDGCTPTQVTRFATTYIDGTIVFVEKSEAELGQDLTGDNVQDDCGFLLAGDADEDGTFDDQDTCVETANPDQQDADLDQLGNQCDPNPFCGDFVPQAPPIAPSEASAGCQKALGKAAVGYLKKRAKAERSCLDKVAKGDLVGDPTALCRGRFVSNVEVPPLDTKTAEKIAKAAEKFEQKVTDKCTNTDLAPLAACADTTADLPACVISAYGGSAIAINEHAYGAGGFVADEAARSCQSAMGKASVNYVAAVTKTIQGCLDKVNKGTLSGDAQALCFGSLTPAGIVAPTDTSTAGKLDKAEQKLRDKIADKCTGTQLMQLMLEACADPTAAGDCLACSHWRQAVEATRSSYGP